MKEKDSYSIIDDNCSVLDTSPLDKLLMQSKSDKENMIPVSTKKVWLGMLLGILIILIRFLPLIIKPSIGPLLIYNRSKPKFLRNSHHQGGSRQVSS